MKKILDYLRYPSTWKGIISVITALGVALKPELIEAIIAAGVGVGGLVAVFFSDSDVKKA